MRKLIVVVVSVAGLVLAGSGVAGAQQQQQPQKPPPPPSSTQFGVPEKGQTQFGTTAQPTPEEKGAYDKIGQTQGLQERLRLIDEFLAKYPQSGLRAGVYGMAAEAYRMENNYDKCIEYGEQALALNDRTLSALMYVSDSLAESSNPTQPDYLERLAKAEGYARRALEVLPQQFAAAQRPADVTEEQHQQRQKYFEAQPHATLGFIYLRRNEYPQAVEELKLATELNQLSPNGFDFLRLGIAQMRMKEYADAEVSLQRAVELGGEAGDRAQRPLASVRGLLRAQQPKPPEEKKPEEKKP